MAAGDGAGAGQLRGHDDRAGGAPLLRHGETLDAVAARLGTNRQTIHRYRERVVCTCALYAAAEGLIRLPERGAPGSAQEREKGGDGEVCERDSRRAQKAKGAQQAGDGRTQRTRKGAGKRGPDDGGEAGD